MTHESDGGWKAEFDRRIDPENYPAGEYYRLEDSDSLLNPEWYPESAYEMDAEKIKSFIESLLTREREAAREEVVRLAEGLKIPPEGTKNKIIRSYESYNQALNDLIEKMVGDK